MTGMRAGVARRRAQVRPLSVGEPCQMRQAVWHRKQRIIQGDSRSRFRIAGAFTVATPAFTAFNGCTKRREHSAALPADTRVSP